MTTELDLDTAAATAEPPPTGGPGTEPLVVREATVVTGQGSSVAARGKRGGWILGLGTAAGGLVVGGFLLTLPLGQRSLDATPAGKYGSLDYDTGGEPTAIPVNTVRPRRKTLERILEQPGSLTPAAQAELYAKASGYLRRIQRELTPSVVTDWVAVHGDAVCAATSSTPIAVAARVSAGAHLALRRAPEKDIGSTVRAGETILEIDAPELRQDVVQKESLWQQRQAELDQALTSIATFEAAVQATTAQQKQVEADGRKAAAERTFQEKQLRRLQELARNRTVTEEVVDEKQYQVNAATAAWESCQAKLQAVQAEGAVVSSKLATARADLQVKAALVRVARDELHRARLLADYANIRAPFDGVITYRGVDEGDFVQNSTSGQTRPLMTVAALDRVKAVLQVPEREALWVQAGAEAALHVDARTGWQVKGRVARSARALDTQSRTMRVEIDLDNPDHKLLPGMYGQVALTLQRIEGAQAIPATAVYSRRGENYILQVTDGVAHRQQVRIRYDDGKELEVVKLVGDREIPLDGSEELIVSNKGEIGDSQRVRATRLPAR
jgi:RND family efflux transporter MFP subunit